MIIQLRENASPSEIDALKHHLKNLGFTHEELIGHRHQLIHIASNLGDFDPVSLTTFSCVDAVYPFDRGLRKTRAHGRKLSEEFSRPLIIAGPCSVEDETQLNAIALILKESGVTHMRGGAYKPRTSPYSFQGLGESGLALLHKVATKHGLKTVSEIVSENDLPLFKRFVDVLQIGARNMQNYALLKAVGKTNLPVVLKRGFANTVEEWLLSAEYLLSAGNENVILCERGVRTFDPMVKQTLDLNGLLVAKELTDLPIVIDPSHAAGNYRFVASLSLAGIAAGADGIMVEIHPDPSQAKSDGGQSLKLDKFKRLVPMINKLYENVHE